MAVLANQREFVRRPGSLTPQYGLFTVAQAMGTMSDTLTGPARQGGIEFETAVCEQPTCYETACLPDLGNKPAGEPYDVVTGDPFVVLTSLLCGSVGMTDVSLHDMLFQRSLAGEQMTVEATFSLGDCAQAPSLANNAVTAADVGPAANVVEAVSQLETAFYAGYGLPGVMHVPYIAAAFLMQAHQIYRDPAGVWRTPTGTYVSIGNYAGTDRAGTPAPPGATNIYMTSPVFIWRTPEAQAFYTPLSAALNRSTNQVNGFKEREYVVAFECEHFVTEATLVTV